MTNGPAPSTAHPTVAAPKRGAARNKPAVQEHNTVEATRRPAGRKQAAHSQDAHILPADTKAERRPARERKPAVPRPPEAARP